LNLPTQRLQRLVYFALDLFARQLECLLHLLAHGVGDLPLELPEDRLDSLADLLLQCLTEILVALGRCSLIAVILGRALAALWSLALPRSSILSSRVGLPIAPGPLLIALAVLGSRLMITLAVFGSRLTLSRLPSRLILVIRLPRPSCLFDSHLASLLSWRFVDRLRGLHPQPDCRPILDSFVSLTRRPLRPGLEG